MGIHNKQPALKEPNKFSGKDWATKIAVAKEARAAGKILRRGKPLTGSSRRSTNLSG
jgi:hypothetical protein